MSRKAIFASYFRKKENDLLVDLNRIVDFAAGNQLPEESTMNKLETLPEILAYAMYNQSARPNLVAAAEKLKILNEMVVNLQRKVQVLITKHDLRHEKLKKNWKTQK